MLKKQEFEFQVSGLGKSREEKLATVEAMRTLASQDNDVIIVNPEAEYHHAAICNNSIPEPKITAIQPRNFGKIGRWYYEPPIYTDHRFILGTVGENPLVCFGINPSTAEPGNLDNTLKSVARIAKNNGFDSWIMFNVYPQRATNPNDMDAERNEQLHCLNMQYIEQIFCRKNVVLWAAWGTIVEKRQYLKEYVKEIVNLAQKYNLPWVSFGPISKFGHPHHPLYLKQDSVSAPFDINEYITKL